MPHSRHTWPSLKLCVPYHYPCRRVQWDRSGATTTLRGPRASGEGTGHLLIHSRDEWISGEPSQLPQALSARSPDRWEPIGETSCYSPRGPRASLLLTPHSPTRKRIQNTQDKHAFKNTHAWFGTLLRLSNIKRATLEERAGLLQ